MKRLKPPYDFLVLGDLRDQGRVEWLTLVLRNLQFRAEPLLWRETRPEAFTEDLERMLPKSRGVIACLSDHSLTDRFPVEYWLAAMQDWLLGQRLFVPVVVRRCDVRFLLGAIEPLDFVLAPPGIAEAMVQNFLSGRGLMPDRWQKEVDSRASISQPIPGISQAERAEALMALGRLCDGADDRAAAWQCFSAALEIRQALFGQLDPQVAATLLTMADYRRAEDQLASAQSFLEEAHRILAVVRSEDLGMLGAVLTRLAEIAETRGDLELALDYTQKETRVAQRRMDLPNTLRAPTYARLGRLLRAHGDPEGARTAYETALRFWGPSTATAAGPIAVTLNNLGVLLQEMGDLDQAREAFTRAVRCWESVATTDSVEVATALLNLANVERQLGHIPEALKNARAALDRREDLLPAGHPAIASALVVLGAILQEQGELGAAETTLLNARSNLALQSTPDPTEQVLVLRRLGELAEARGDALQAAVYLGEAGRILATVREIADPGVLGTILAELARLAELRQDWLGAREQWSALLVQQECSLTAEHPACARIWQRLAQCEVHLGEWANAQAALGEALTIFTKQLPPEHPELLELYRQQGDLSLAAGDWPAAATQLERVLDLLMRTREPTDPALAPAMESLAAVKLVQGAIGEARALGERALSIREQAYGRHSPQVIPALSGLVELQIATGNRRQGERLLARAEDINLHSGGPSAAIRQELASLRDRLPTG